MKKELTSDADMLAGVDLLTELLGRVAAGGFVSGKQAGTGPVL